MSGPGIHNARVQSADILGGRCGPELCVIVEGDGWSQGLQLLLGNDAAWTACVFPIMWAVEVESWSEMAGSYVRVVRDAGGMLTGIGHIFKDRWFFRDKWKPGDPLAPVDSDEDEDEEDAE